jgi:hypothetical protein
VISTGSGGVVAVGTAVGSAGASVGSGAASSVAAGVAGVHATSTWLITRSDTIKINFQFFIIFFSLWIGLDGKRTCCFPLFQGKDTNVTVDFYSLTPPTKVPFVK